MKEVCGFKGLDGGFYEKESNCKKADLTFKIKGIERRLHNFHTEIESYLRHSSLDTQIFYNRHVDEVMKAVALAVLRNHESLSEVIKLSKDLKKELDELKAEQKGGFSKWWVKTKWW